ncbi:MAG: HYExAFE family protein [Planctomycetia bacterium]|nr:HYExAFE family protein [Planctomycetia bacterium]
MLGSRQHARRALEAYLRQEGVTYQGGEVWCRNAAPELGDLSTPDLVLERPGGVWLWDVKGRKFPSGVKKPQYWRNWVGQEDLVALARWEARLGGRGFFVFAYEIFLNQAPVLEEHLFAFQGKEYAFIAISLGDYASHCRHLSARWQTVTMSVKAFRELARPLDELLN